MRTAANADPSAPIRVLIVSQYFWPESFRINDLVLGLTERGYEVTALTGKPNYPTGSFFRGYGFWTPLYDDYKGVRVVRVPIIPRGRGGRARLVLNYVSFVLSASLFGPLLCRGRYDAIFVFEPSPVTVGLPAIVFKWLNNAPILFWVQDLWPDSLLATGAVQSPATLRLVERLVRFIYRNCDRILVQSQRFRSSIERLGVESDRIVYFPNTAEALYIPVTLDSNAPERTMLPSGFRVMFAGNIGAAQDFGTILSAAERLRERTDIHWIIFGEGRRFSWVQEQVRRRRLDAVVHLMGHHLVESMPRYFSLSDVMLLTLKKHSVFALTIPAKLQSYMACAKPIIAAIEGEGARIIREAGAGLAVPMEDPEALAEAVLTLYQMPQTQRGEMGTQGRRYFEEHFERGMLLRRLDQWIREVTGRNGPRTLRNSLV